MTTPALSPSLVTYMSALTYQAESKRLVSLMPLSGIYWDDEIPDLDALFSLGEDDKMQYLRLFAIRIRLWRGEALNVRKTRTCGIRYVTQVPTCPVFMRSEYFKEDRKTQREAEEETGEILRTDCLSGARRSYLEATFGSGANRNSRLNSISLNERADRAKKKLLLATRV